MCVCTHAYVCAYMYVCMYLYMYVCACTYLFLNFSKQGDLAFSNICELQCFELHQNIKMQTDFFLTRIATSVFFKFYTFPMNFKEAV